LLKDLWMLSLAAILPRHDPIKKSKRRLPSKWGYTYILESTEYLDNLYIEASRMSVG
jgi:hypothetical protein